MSRGLVVAGRERSYLMSAPARLAEPAPLVLALHGGGDNPTVFARQTRLSERAGLRGFVVAYPAGTPIPGSDRFMGLWNSGPNCRPAEPVDDVAFLLAVIDDIAARVPVDRARVYATGYSNGGTMAYRLLCQAADVLRGVAVAGCSLDYQDHAPSRAVPVLHLHGTEDRFQPYHGGTGVAPDFPGPFLGAVETTRRLADWYGCGQPDVSWRRGSATCSTYSGLGGVEIALCTITGMGHHWPGDGTHLAPERATSGRRRWFLSQMGPGTDDVDATEAALDFFDRHRG